MGRKVGAGPGHLCATIRVAAISDSGAARLGGAPDRFDATRTPLHGAGPVWRCGTRCRDPVSSYAQHVYGKGITTRRASDSAKATSDAPSPVLTPDRACTVPLVPRRGVVRKGCLPVILTISALPPFRSTLSPGSYEQCACIDDHGFRCAPPSFVNPLRRMSPLFGVDRTRAVRYRAANRPYRRRA